VDAAWDLPVTPPVSPMLAASPVDAVPDAPDLAFEPKWDGFRAIVFKSGERVEIHGRSGDDLSYAFPELVDAVRSALPQRVVLDGEIVVIRDGGLDFAALGSRLRPRGESASIRRLAEEIPATLIAFDILALDDRSLMDAPYLDRRTALEALPVTGGGVRITPMTRDRVEAERWFADVEGAGLDGLIAKRVGAAYQPGKRVMAKVKHRRTLDAVVAGWRPHAKDPDEVGSLLLGLYDERGRLHHVGAVSGLSAARRRELTDDLRDLRLADDADHPWRVTDDAGDDGVRRPGGVNRWSGGREKAWHALRPERVAEVAYDHFEGSRLRHLATWLRWRPDRVVTSCTYAQAPEIAPARITDVLDLG
jgi:ATP-dependent DNA ligase